MSLIVFIPLLPGHTFLPACVSLYLQTKIKKILNKEIEDSSAKIMGIHSNIMNIKLDWNTRIDRCRLKLDEEVDKDSILAAMNKN